MSTNALAKELRNMARDIRELGRAIARAQLDALDRLGKDVHAAEVLEVDDSFDIRGFWQAAQGLPSYAQPRFVRLLPRLSTTGTFKIQKTQLRLDGVDPGKIQDPLFVRTDEGYVALDAERYGDVVEGRLRL